MTTNPPGTGGRRDGPEDHGRDDGEEHLGTADDGRDGPGQEQGEAHRAAPPLGEEGAGRRRDGDPVQDRDGAVARAEQTDVGRGRGEQERRPEGEIDAAQRRRGPERAPPQAARLTPRRRAARPGGRAAPDGGGRWARIRHRGRTAPGSVAPDAEVAARPLRSAFAEAQGRDDVVLGRGRRGGGGRSADEGGGEQESGSEESASLHGPSMYDARHKWCTPRTGRAAAWRR